jgi:co-chaperonin GroES (HSP10)
MSETQQLTLRPANNLIMIEKYQEYESIVMPGNSQPGAGDLFVVKDTGPGFLNDKNERVPMDIKIGDIVAVLGKIFTVQFLGNDYHIARSEDVIAYCRG